MAEAERSYHVKAGSKKVRKLDEPMERMEQAAGRGDVVLPMNEKEDAAMRKASREAQRMARTEQAKTVIDMPSSRRDVQQNMPVVKPEDLQKEMDRRIAEQRTKIQQIPKVDQKHLPTQIVRRRDIAKPEKKLSWWDKFLGQR